MPPAARIPLLLLLLAGCQGLSGDFPSLLPRPAEADRQLPKGGAEPAHLAAEERASLAADIRSARRALGDAGAAIDAADRALGRALSAAGRAAPGSEPWATAQMMLSRFDAERARLGAIDSGLVPARRMADSLPPGDEDRQALDRLSADLDALLRATASRSAEAARQLSR